MAISDQGALCTAILARSLHEATPTATLMATTYPSINSGQKSDCCSRADGDPAEHEHGIPGNHQREDRRMLFFNSGYAQNRGRAGMFLSRPASTDRYRPSGCQLRSIFRTCASRLSATYTVLRSLDTAN